MKTYPTLYDPEHGELWTSTEAARYCGIKKETYLMRVLNRPSQNPRIPLPTLIGYYQPPKSTALRPLWASHDVKRWHDERRKQKLYHSGPKKNLENNS